MLGVRIRQARLVAGVTQENLANLLQQRGYSVTKQAISKYEKNLSPAPAQFLLHAASIFGVPTSYFTHQTQTTVQWLAFRGHSTLPSAEQEAVKTYAADVAELQIELQNLLYPLEEIQLPPIRPVRTVEDAEQAAMNLRKHWRLDNHPIDSLVQTVEDHQVVVVEWKQAEGKFDGLSGWCGKHPVTVMSTMVEADRRRFTLAHELGYLFMDTSNLTDKEAEKLANRFAATLLVPTERAYHELGRKRTRLDWEEIGILKRKYGLSMAAWIYRAKDLEIITEHYGKQLQMQIRQMGWHKQEPEEYRYKGDEQPLLLEQMAHRVTSEGLMSADRIQRAYPQWKEQLTPQQHSSRLSVYDLMEMPETERNHVLAEIFARAAQEDFEQFEAAELHDYGEDFA